MKLIKLTLVSLCVAIQTVQAAPFAIVLPSVPAAKVEHIEPSNDVPKVAKKSYTYKELKTTAETSLNRKLSLKEKFALRLAKNKINKSGLLSSAAEGKGKSQITAAILCFFLGGLGIHDFYLGNTWGGIGKIILAITSFLIFPAIALGIWVLVDFILILLGNRKPKNGDYTKTI